MGAPIRFETEAMYVGKICTLCLKTPSNITCKQQFHLKGKA